MIASRSLFLFILGLIVAPAVASPALADATDRVHVPTGLRPGYGDSFWGPIPAPADSTASEVTPRGRPAWEYPLIVPYRIVQAPFRAFFAGAGATYIYLDDSGLIYRLGELLGPKEIPYGAMVSFKAGGLSGFGGGLTIFHNHFLGKANHLKIRTSLTTTGEAKATLGTQFGAGGPNQLEVGGGYRLRRNSRFFGLGPNSLESDKSYFSQETSWGGAVLSRRIAELLRLELGALYSGVGTRRPSGDEHPAVPDLFDGTQGRRTPKGYGDLSKGFTLNIAIVRDATTTTGRPESGSIHRLRATYFTPTGDEARVSFWSYRFDFEQFVGLWFSERALALRGYLNWLDDRSEEIPFQRLLTNDEPDLFRGYRDYRWRDRGLTGLSIEYRWPLWANNQTGASGLDAYLLTDLGQVFNQFEEISAGNAHLSYGGGIRFVGAGGFTGRVEIAFSEDESVFRLSSDQIFQYARGGIFNGRDQSALR